MLPARRILLITALGFQPALHRCGRIVYYRNFLSVTLFGRYPMWACRAVMMVTLTICACRLLACKFPTIHGPAAMLSAALLVSAAVGCKTSQYKAANLPDYLQVPPATPTSGLNLAGMTGPVPARR